MKSEKLGVKLLIDLEEAMLLKKFFKAMSRFDRTWKFDGTLEELSTSEHEELGDLIDEMEDAL